MTLLIMTFYTKIVLIGWKVWWIESLFILIIKNHLAYKLKLPGTTLCNCRHWWTNLIQGPCKGFIWFLDCISQVFPEECLLFRFVHTQLIPFRQTKLPLKIFTFIVDGPWYWIWIFFGFLKQICQFYILIIVIFIWFICANVQITVCTSWRTWWQINIFWTNTTCQWFSTRGVTLKLRHINIKF